MNTEHSIAVYEEVLGNLYANMVKEKDPGKLVAMMQAALNAEVRLRELYDHREFETAVTVKGLTVTDYAEKALAKEIVERNANGDKAAPVETAEEPTPETAAETPKPAITKDALRQKLADYANKYPSLDLPAIFAGMGYEKLSAIPAERYGELLGIVEKEIA